MSITMENLRSQRSVIKTGYDDGWQKGLAGMVWGEEGRDPPPKKKKKKKKKKKEGRAEGPEDKKKATARGVFLQWACLPSE